MKTVTDESELPFRKDGVTEYTLLGATFVQYRTYQAFVRSKIDPTVLMDIHSGDCFNRADGERWEWPAYVRDRKILWVNDERTPEAWSPLQGKGAYCDDKIYDTKAKAAA